MQETKYRDNTCNDAESGIFPGSRKNTGDKITPEFSLTYKTLLSILTVIVRIEVQDPTVEARWNLCFRSLSEFGESFRILLLLRV